MMNSMMNSMMNNRVKSIMKSVVVLILLGFVISPQVYGQSKHQTKLNNIENNRSFYVEALIQSYQKDSVYVNFMIRIDSDLLGFEQNLLDDKQTNRDVLIAYPNVDIEIKDASGIIRKRLHWEETVFIQKEENMDSKTFFGLLSAPLKKDTYTAKITLLDKNKPITTKKDAINATMQEEVVSDRPIFAEMDNQNANVIKPCVFDGNIPFNAKNINAYILAKNLIGWKYTIESIVDEDNMMWRKELLYEGDIVELDGSGFELALLKNENLIQGELNQTTDDNDGYKLYQLNVPVSTIIPQKFNLYCYKPGGLDSVKLKYDVIWNNKPKSLLDIEYATEMMYYVLDDTQYSEINSGKDKQRFQYLLEYWQTQDHTPETPYIEAMDVYFHRVDYAQEAYSTVKHKDGAKTPRGQICILYGKPDYTETMVEKKIVKEVWEYDDLQLRFVFNVTSPGEYVLVETNAEEAEK